MRRKNPYEGRPSPEEGREIRDIHSGIQLLDTISKLESPEKIKDFTQELDSFERLVRSQLPNLTELAEEDERVKQNGAYSPAHQLHACVKYLRTQARKEKPNARNIQAFTSTAGELTLLREEALDLGGLLTTKDRLHAGATLEHKIPMVNAFPRNFGLELCREVDKVQNLYESGRVVTDRDVGHINKMLIWLQKELYLKALRTDKDGLPSSFDAFVVQLMAINSHLKAYRERNEPLPKGRQMEEVLYAAKGTAYFSASIFREEFKYPGQGWLVRYVSPPSTLRAE